MKFYILLFASVLVLGGCQSDPYNQEWSRFLKTSDPAMTKWLDEEILVNLKHAALWQFNKIPGLGFERQPILLRGRAARAASISVNKETISRRELLYRFHRDYGIIIDFVDVGGRLFIRFRSQGYIDLMGG